MRELLEVAHVLHTLGPRTVGGGRGIPQPQLQKNPFVEVLAVGLSARTEPRGVTKSSIPACAKHSENTKNTPNVSETRPNRFQNPSYGYAVLTPK